MRRLLVLLALLALPSLASAREAWRGFCEGGNQSVVTSGISSSTKVQRSYPRCTVLILVHGGGVATIYADNNGTPLANPFQANLDGSFVWYANDGRYDEQISNANIAAPFTFLDILLCDPFAAGAVCSGGAGGSHNLLSATHLDTIPFSPPVRGDLITAQQLTSPAGVLPSWARLALGTTGQILLSNGLDALWGSLTAGTGITITSTGGGSSLTIASSGGGSGCILPGTDTGVVSEHPAGTCYDSANFTWDDAVSRQNMQAGITNTFSADLLGNQNQLFSFGQSNSSSGSSIFAFGTGTYAGGSIFAMGTTLTVSQAGSTASANPNKIWLQGISDQVNYSGTGSSGTRFMTNIHVNGDTNVITATANNPKMKDIYIFGLLNNVTSNGTGSTGAQVTDEEDTFIVGEGNEASATNQGTTSKIYLFGDSNTADTTGFGNLVSDVTLVGANNAASATGTLSLTNISALGNGNTLQITSGSNSHDMVAVGRLNTIQNCTDCIAIGKSITLSSATTMELGGTLNVKRTPLAFTAVPACAAGTEGSFASITTSNSATNGVIITGGGTNHVLAFCDGTNWKVVVGT